MKYIKYIIAFVIVIVAAFAIFKLTEVQRAENTFTSAMEALKEGDLVKVSGYVKGGEIADKEFAEKYKEEEALLKLLLSNMTYKVNYSEKVDSKTIKVNADVTAFNMQKIFADSLKEILALYLKNAFTFGENKLDENQLNIETMNIVMEKMKSDSAEMVTNTIDINVVKTNTGWKIDTVDSVKDAITGGLFSALKNLTQSLG